MVVEVVVGEIVEVAMGGVAEDEIIIPSKKKNRTKFLVFAY